MPILSRGGAKNDGSTTCGGKDTLFTFTGHVGKIISVPDHDANEDQYGVTFNGGRTAYMFSEEEIKVDVREEMKNEPFSIPHVCPPAAHLSSLNPRISLD